jgi:hypothetical protein
LRSGVAGAFTRLTDNIGVPCLSVAIRADESAARCIRTRCAIATGAAGWGGTWLELAAVIATLAGLESRARAAAVPWWWTVVSATFHTVHSRGALYGYVVVAAVTHVLVERSQSRCRPST